MLKDVHNQRYMVASSLLRSLHEDSQHLMETSNDPSACARHTSSAGHMKTRRWTLQDVQRETIRDRRVLKKRVQLCSRLLQLSLTVSLAITQGAGGCAISPIIRYRRFLDFTKTDLLNKQDTGDLLAALKLLFESGKARPTDVNEKGETILHVCTPETVANVALTQ